MDSMHFHVIAWALQHSVRVHKKPGQCSQTVSSHTKNMSGSQDRARARAMISLLSGR